MGDRSGREVRGGREREGAKVIGWEEKNFVSPKTKMKKKRNRGKLIFFF